MQLRPGQAGRRVRGGPRQECQQLHGGAWGGKRGRRGDHMACFAPAQDAQRVAMVVQGLWWGVLVGGKGGKGGWRVRGSSSHGRLQQLAGDGVRTV